mmetsp:Transcript_37946/g.49966  ORF Transcript_37946/g.49966 Transcript_37946/m.49966 type:complete len:254 (-) Transcript_37946:443-1204(-)
MIWVRHLWNDFEVSYDCYSCSSPRVLYLKCKLAKLQSQHVYYQSVKKSHPKLHSFQRFFRGVCLKLADFGCVKNERLAKVLSKKRNYAMGTLLTERNEDIVAFKKTQKSPTLLNFLPLDVCHPRNFTPRTALRDLPAIEFPGLMDYAVHLIELRQEHEQYRYSVLYTFFKNLLVFETKQAIQEFVATYGYEPYAVALDEYSEEELNEPHPKFSWYGFRENFIMHEPQAYNQKMDRALQDLQSALAHLQYNSLA